MGEECAEVVVNINHPDLNRIFHYRLPAGMEKPPPGTRVTVPFGSRLVEGWIVGYSEPEPGVSLREIAGLGRPDFTKELLDLARWMSWYYLHPLAEILELMSPPDRPKRLIKCTSPEEKLSPQRPEDFDLTGEQQEALRKIEEALSNKNGGRFLLYGVTGSGKTEVYLRATEFALALGRQVLYLVPEIALTPQIGALFQGAFGERVAIWHHRLARGEKYRLWEDVREGAKGVVIGTRSAVFAPFCNLGLIIVDEEHDPSYKEQERPYYHARQVALIRSFLNKAVVVLGSATPSLESFSAAGRKKLQLLTISRRPPGRSLPRTTVVDMRRELNSGGEPSIFSRYLQEQIKLRLKRKEQVILFYNRRGYAPLVFCPGCGEVLKCRYCSISLVYHRQTGDLRCHYCNTRLPLPANCPSCGSNKRLCFLGTGIQRVEQELSLLFPGARVLRLDYDTTRGKGAYGQILSVFAGKKADILLGTQMVTKGHDFPGVTLVGVLNADLSLNLPDYRSAERTFQILTQVAGRTGRGPQPGEVVVQTYHPEHYSIMAACRGDSNSFYREEARRRRALEYPPYGELIRVRLSSCREEDVASLASELAGELRRQLAGDQVAVLGPAPAPVLRVKGFYRWQVLLKGKTLPLRSQIEACLAVYRKNNSVIISVEVDPFGY